MNRTIFLDRDGVINKIHYDEDIGCAHHTPQRILFFFQKFLKLLKE
ncbi:MAG: hypothetical protein AAB116_20885 [Candidatus Poribacteria bacterium]